MQDQDEAEKAVDRAISLFRFLHDKDMFEGHYCTLLAKRLLNATSASDDLERLVIGKLKVPCCFLSTISSLTLKRRLSVGISSLRKCRACLVTSAFPANFRMRSKRFLQKTILMYCAMYLSLLSLHLLLHLVTHRLDRFDELISNNFLIACHWRIACKCTHFNVLANNALDFIAQHPSSIHGENVGRISGMLYCSSQRTKTHLAAKFGKKLYGLIIQS